MGMTLAQSVSYDNAETTGAYIGQINAVIASSPTSLLSLTLPEWERAVGF
jgi:hypothetical protein